MTVTSQMLISSTALQQRRSLTVTGATLAAAAAVTCAAAAAWLGTPVAYVLMAIVASLAGCAVLAMALQRFDLFVFSLLAVRPSLDQLPSAGPVDPSSALALLFVVSSIVWLARRRGVLSLPSPVSLAFLSFAAVAAISCLTSPLPILSAIATSKVLAGALMLVVLEQLLRDEPQRSRMLVLIVLGSAVLPCVAGLWQFLTSGGTLVDQTLGLSRVVGTFLHPNPFATYLGMVLVLGIAVLPYLARSQQVLTVGLLLLVLVDLAGTFGRGGWIAAVLGVGYLIAKRSMWMFVFGSLAMGTIGMLVPAVRQRFADLGAAPPVPGVPANSLEWRFQYWQDIIPLANRNPITGIGFEAVQNTTASRLPPHNAFVQAYVELGVLGLVALIAMIIALTITLRRRLRDSTPGLDRALASAAMAIGLGLLAQTLTENLLSQTMAVWYLAAAGTLGLPSKRAYESSGEFAGRGPTTGECLDARS